MTRTQAKNVCQEGRAVVYAGIEYACISALIYRKCKDGFIMQVELLDKNRNSVVIAVPEAVQETEKGRE